MKSDSRSSMYLLDFFSRDTTTVECRLVDEPSEVTTDDASTGTPLDHSTQCEGPGQHFTQFEPPWQHFTQCEGPGQHFTQCEGPGQHFTQCEGPGLHFTQCEGPGRHAS